MFTPTMVSVKSGPHSEGYTFCIAGNENREFTCRYDGNEVNLSIFVHGTRVSEVLDLVHGLLHKDSDFKKKLFKEYAAIKPKSIKRIVFDSTTGYEFVITPECDTYELMKQYYRSYRYEVNDGESEDEIVARHQEVFKKNLQENLAFCNSQIGYAQ